MNKEFMALDVTISEESPIVLALRGCIRVCVGNLNVVISVAQSIYAPWGLSTLCPNITSVDPEGMTYMLALALKFYILNAIGT